MSNYSSIGSGVPEPQVAINYHFPLTRHIALTTVLCTNVLDCDGMFSLSWIILYTCIQDEILAELEQLEKEELEDDVTADTLPSVPSEEPEQTRLSKGKHLIFLFACHRYCNWSAKWWSHYVQSVVETAGRHSFGKFYVTVVGVLWMSAICYGHVSTVLFMACQWLHS